MMKAVGRIGMTIESVARRALYCKSGPLPQPDIDGTFESANWSTEVRRETTEGFMNTHRSIMSGLSRKYVNTVVK